MIKHLTALPLWITFLCPGSSAQSFDAEKLDSLLSSLENNNKAMGSLTISKNSSIIYDRSIGYAYINDNRRKMLSEKTEFRIGSITKTFTAVLILQLIEEEKLSLTTPLAAFFKEVPNSNKITIAHLLSHQSGLYNYTDDWDSWRFDKTSREEMLSIIAGKEPGFEPGAETSYSNANYMLLGFIIEEITGKSYSQVLQKRIISKLSLQDTYYGGKIDTTAGEAFSYNFENGAWRQIPETDMSAAAASGAVVSTTRDLAKFMEALFSRELINENSMSHMLTINEGQGMGMEQLPFYDETLYGKGGMIDYFQSYALYFPQHHVSIVYISNGYGGVSIIDILTGVLHIYFDKPYVVPSFTPAASPGNETNNSPSTNLTAKISGKVLDHSGKEPIPYANIGIKNSPMGTLSNEDGSFSIIIPEEYINDILTFSALGYGEESIPVKSISGAPATIELLEKSTLLKEVVVSARPVKHETVELGNRYWQGPGGIIYSDSVYTGSAMALLIEPGSYPVYPEKARLRIQGNTLVDFKVRLRLLKVDSLSGLPGEDLLNKSIIIESDMNKGWLKVDLTPYLVKISNPFYLAFEWIIDEDVKNLLWSRYREYAASNPEDFYEITRTIDGKEVTAMGHDFHEGVMFGASGAPFSLENYKCFYRTSSLGEWRRSIYVLACRITLSY